MLKQIFKELDDKLTKEYSEIFLDEVTFKVFGQAALIEAGLEIALAQTGDLDAYSDAGWSLLVKFNELLNKKHGMRYDMLSKEAWMPEGTEYSSIFSGRIVKAFVAKAESILISKAKMCPEKNKVLTEYIAKGPSALFVRLCKDYEINIESILV